MKINPSLRGRDSYCEYFETTNLPKEEEGKTEDAPSDDFSALFKNSSENNNNGPVVGQKDPSQTMMVSITLPQKFHVVTIWPTPCLTLT